MLGFLHASSNLAEWPTNDTKASQDGPGQRIVFTMVPFDAFG